MSLWKSITGRLSKSPRHKAARRRGNRRNLRIESLEGRRVFAAATFDAGGDEVAACYYEEQSAAVGVAAEISAEAQAAPSTPANIAPVLIVVANQDFWYQDYADTRAAIEAQGLEVVVAAATTNAARPQANSGQGADGGVVQPDIALADVNAEDYSAIVFTGGWGMAQYQYGFEGTYHNSAYNGDLATKQIANDLVNEFLAQDKHVAAVCYGVSVLAYARVDGESLIEGRQVTGWNGAVPSSDTPARSGRDQIEANGAHLLASGSIGDPATSSDDVWIEGKFITAENYDSAHAFGSVVAREVIAAEEARNVETQSSPKPVLMVIANQDFYHREYYETRESLEAAGLEVVVAAATTEIATPHAISVIEGREPNVTPDLPLADVNSEDYSAIVFVGGYGAASYQYANESTYDNAIYRGSQQVKEIVNDLINEFIAEDKYVTAICNGVTVLAWARVNGVSPLAGRQVASWAHELPSADDGVSQTTRDHIEANGAIQFLSGAIGDPTTSTDDVWIDGRIITAENYDSSYAFGSAIAERLLDSAR